jgi:hypothetical protein
MELKLTPIEDEWYFLLSRGALIKRLKKKGEREGL